MPVIFKLASLIVIMSTATVVDPVEQAQIEDERKLTANGQKIDKIMGFLFDGVNRHEAGRKVEEAEANAAVPREGKVFHHYKGKRVGIAHNASNLMQLNAALGSGVCYVVGLHRLNLRHTRLPGVFI